MTGTKGGLPPFAPVATAPEAVALILRPVPTPDAPKSSPSASPARDYRPSPRTAAPPQPQGPSGTQTIRHCVNRLKTDSPHPQPRYLGRRNLPTGPGSGAGCGPPALKRVRTTLPRTPQRKSQTEVSCPYFPFPPGRLKTLNISAGAGRRQPNPRAPIDTFAQGRTSRGNLGRTSRLSTK